MSGRLTRLRPGETETSLRRRVGKVGSSFNLTASARPSVEMATSVDVHSEVVDSTPQPATGIAEEEGPREGFVSNTSFLSLI